jgi:anionic cell wall polymer biosynthesis LytR-Cps2A-Psr (LCP) family protein
MATIEENLGIPIDHWIRVNYEGFAKVVDALGGVDMTVPCPVNLRYKPPTSDAEQEMILQPGVYHMDGATALRYVRTRRDDSDFDRARRQHAFLKAMWDQTKSPDILPKIPALWLALKNSYQTDLKLGDVLALAPMALDLQPQRIRSRYIGPGQTTSATSPDGWFILLPDAEKVQELIAGLYAPPSTTADQVAGEAARIQVRNGTGRPQLGQIAADQLRWRGLKVVDVGPADRGDYAKTQILVFNEKPGAVDLLTRELKLKPENVLRQPAPDEPADIRLILGNDYDPCR